ncbi:YbaB/EbfC family nucleoid-associated protein [Salininema proteolyticum]|uniref:YbaB/EbfC family nucleoid-associated protein n=1 Tax=Salininema proteolyticum TaxID=1607685 RepID=A0ABV8U2W7_9ACTN
MHTGNDYDEDDGWAEFETGGPADVSFAVASTAPPPAQWPKTFTSPGQYVTITAHSRGEIAAIDVNPAVFSTRDAVGLSTELVAVVNDTYRVLSTVPEPPEEDEAKARSSIERTNESVELARRRSRELNESVTDAIRRLNAR